MRTAQASVCHLRRLNVIEWHVNGVAVHQTAIDHNAEIITSVGAESETGPLRMHHPAFRADTSRIRCTDTPGGLHVDRDRIPARTASSMAAAMAGIRQVLEAADA